MVGAWDSKFKLLMAIAPQDIVSWLLKGARLEREVSPHLQGRNIDADILYWAIIDGRRCLIHIEFQRKGDKDMARRVWEYNVLATCKFGVPVYSFVIYLKKGGKIATSPYIWQTHDGKQIHCFHFWTIKLWETPTEELLESGLEGLLPLLPLTREGKKREVVEYAIERLMPADGGPKPDLLTLTYGIASLVFNKEDDHKWLQRRFSMLRDILSESWAFKEIEEEALERGRKMGREEGREEGFEQGYAKSQKEQLAGLRATFLTLVQTRFPDLVPAAKKKARSVRTPIAMQALILGIACARDCDEAWKHLVTE